MDLLRRLWHLARAQVGGKGSGREEAPGADFSGSWSPTREPSPAPDPQLAQHYANPRSPTAPTIGAAAWKRSLKQCHPDCTPAIRRNSGWPI